MDTIVEGDPTFSFTHTAEGGRQIYGQYSRFENLKQGLTDLRTFLPLPVLAGSLVGAVILLIRGLRRMALPTLAVLVYGCVTFAFLALSGLPSNRRYLLLTAAMLAICLGYGAAAWVRVREKRSIISTVGVGAVLAVVVLGTVARNVDKMRGLRNTAQDSAALLDSTTELADRGSAPARNPTCSTITAPAPTITAYEGYFLDRRPVLSSDGTGGGADLFVAPADPATARWFLTRGRLDSDASFKVPPSYREVAHTPHWVLFARSGRCK